MDEHNHGSGAASAESMVIWIKALFYMCVVGGGWLVALPASLLFFEHGQLAVEINGPFHAHAGTVVFAVGMLLALLSGYYLIEKGKGTPLPLDPPRALVSTGPYAYVRNPQGIAMTLMVAGEVIAVRSSLLWLVLPLTWFYLEVLFGGWEDRQLFKLHGPRYLLYRTRVRKWLPKFAKTRSRPV